MDGFLWGVSTSAYQSEGGYNGPNEPRTNWAAAEERGDVARCGRAADFWTRFREDFARCRKMGLNTFRLGIEWSRVQPHFTDVKQNQTSPAFDFSALDHYAEMLAECRGHGLEPVVTLHHFVHPAWLGVDPWLESETAAFFENYVRAAVPYLNEKLVARGYSPIRFFITINEPNMLVFNTYLGHQFPSDAASGFHSVIAACNQLLIAHVRAYNAIHDIYAKHGWSEPMVTFNNYCSDLYWLDKALLDVIAARERNVTRADVRDYIHQKIAEFAKAFRAARIPLHKDLPYYFGAIAKRISNRIGYRWFQPEHFAPLLDAIYQSPRKRLFDYLGLDYYDPFAAHIFRLPVWWDHEFKNKSFHSWMMNTVTSKWWDWRVLPRGLHFFCKYYSEDFADRSVLIAENGMALRCRWDNQCARRRDKITRSEFLRLHVHEVTKIVGDGVPLIGYLHWSLFDNYEWGSYTPRFGLFSLDYTRGTERLAENHMGDRPSETYAELVREAREKMLSGDAVATLSSKLSS
jgi:beta-glucosidase